MFTFFINRKIVDIQLPCIVRDDYTQYPQKKPKIKCLSW